MITDLTELGQSDQPFAVPVDAGDILVVFTKHGLSAAPDAIPAHFEELAGHNCAIRIHISWPGHPIADEFFRDDTSFTKGFTKAGWRAELDRGFHVPSSKIVLGYAGNRIAHLPYHKSAWQNWWQITKLKLAPVCDIGNVDARAAWLANPCATSARPVAGVAAGKHGYTLKYDHDLLVAFPPNMPQRRQSRRPFGPFGMGRRGVSSRRHQTVWRIARSKRSTAT